MISNIWSIHLQGYLYSLQLMRLFQAPPQDNLSLGNASASARNQSLCLLRLDYAPLSPLACRHANVHHTVRQSHPPNFAVALHIIDLATEIVYDIN